MPSKIQRNHSVQNAVPHVNFLSHNPSQSSTLGDVGFIDDKGTWRKVVNILDSESCKELGIKSLQLARGQPQYITQAKRTPFDEPIVDLYNGESHKLYRPEEIGRYKPKRILLTSRTNYPTLLTMNRENGVLEDSTVSRILFIFPNADKTATALIAGPKIFVRTLNLPGSVLQIWLGMYRSQIGKFARKMMDLFPPDKGSKVLCLSVTELFTETWRTIFIRAERNADPIALAWKLSDNASGAWINLDVPQSTSVICGGFASYPVR